jgi:hypothetical protein
LQNHFHTDAVQLAITALGVIVVMQLIRIVGTQMADSKTPLLATLGKGMGGLVTFSA